ncbi:MAG TPA: periplasmic heavy metal sensor [Pyrinomonadaceae bacterium]
MTRTFITFIATLLLLASTCSVFAMQEQTSALVQDPIEQLRLTPEQRQRMRMILEQNKGERQAANRRVREANVALDQALDAEPVDENLVEQRVNELAAAQTAQLRMRIQSEMMIRRELRPEQLAVLRSLHLQIRDVMNGQRPLNMRPGRESLRPNQRNSAAPVYPHRNILQP